MILYVDVDDTLVLWDNDGSYTINNALIRRMYNFRSLHPDAKIVIWSSGGLEYAIDWTSKLGLG